MASLSGREHPVDDNGLGTPSTWRLRLLCPWLRSRQSPPRGAHLGRRAGAWHDPPRIGHSRKGGYPQALGDGGDVPLGRLEASAGGRRREFDCSRRSLGGLRGDGPPVDLFESRLHKTMAQHPSHPQRDAWSSRRAGSFT
jgi:hypothetical protein